MNNKAFIILLKNTEILEKMTELEHAELSLICNQKLVVHCDELIKLNVGMVTY